MSTDTKTSPDPTTPGGPSTSPPPPAATLPKGVVRDLTLREDATYSYWKLSPMGKLFFASMVAGVLLGKKSPFKLRATPQQVKAITHALAASKAFQDELKKQGATVDSVIQKLNLKHLTAADFERITGKPWPL